jgi:hypothetical protein
MYKTWNGICAVLLGVLVPGARCYCVCVCVCVCVCQERGVTGCVVGRSDVLLGVWVPRARCYWVCGCQERGVTGRVGARREVLLGVWVPGSRCYWVCGCQERGTSVVTERLRNLSFEKKTSKSCSFVRTYKLEYFICNKSRFSVRNNLLPFLWAPPIWSTTFLKSLPTSPAQRQKTVKRITSYTSSAILIA